MSVYGRTIREAERPAKTDLNQNKTVFVRDLHQKWLRFSGSLGAGQSRINALAMAQDLLLVMGQSHPLPFIGPEQFHQIDGNLLGSHSK